MEFQHSQRSMKRWVMLRKDNDGEEWMGYAGGGIRTLKPLRAFVFETNAYTVPPRRHRKDYPCRIIPLSEPRCQPFRAAPLLCVSDMREAICPGRAKKSASRRFQMTLAEGDMNASAKAIR